MGTSYIENIQNKISSSVHLAVSELSELSELMKYQYLREVEVDLSLPHRVMMKNCNISCGNALYLSKGLHHLSK